ncbi:MAG: septum formation inhibitor Maf [Firmicutes bacterium]|jgi:septum formation protein|nr:septum formation inhibitor Maf [Bacillota bacterium]
MPKLVLASQSPRRQELLTALGVDFTVIPAEVDENLIHEESPEALAEALAYAKARWVADRAAEAVVVAADTIVLLDSGEVLGKPQGREEAARMLSRLSGQGHRVVTGVAIIDTQTCRSKVFHETTRVFFRTLSDQEIERYVATGEPLDKAGAYGIQGKGALLVERIEGCYFNVVGFPLARLGQVLTEFGVSLL